MSSKSLLALAMLLLTASSGHAQGTVDFRNGGVTFKTVANRYIYFGTPGPGAGTPTPGSADPNRVVGTNFVAGLWYVPGADQGGQIGSGRQAGRLFHFRDPLTSERNKGTWMVPAGESPLFTLDGVDIGQSASLQVRVWDLAKFASFEAAGAAGEYGASTPFNYTVPPAGSAAELYDMDNFRTFNTFLVPEPSMIGLGILGAAALLLLRRRK